MRHWNIAARLAALGLGMSLVAALPQGLPAGKAAAAADSAAVRIDNFNFRPPTLVVAPGTTVTWTNADDSFSQTFTAPGEYDYFCSIHPYMTAKIVVKPGAKPSN